MFTEVMVKGGYRWDKFTVQLGAGSYITDLELSSCEFGVSFNLRDREHRHALTTFEAM